LPASCLASEVPFSVTAVRHGAVAFAGTVSLKLAVMAAAGAL
jgi:hypothetical protein